MKYELTILFHPDLEIDIEQPINKVKKVIADAGGEILRHDNWGKRKTAYPIKGENHAVYSFFLIDLSPDATKKIEEALNLSDEVLRYLLVKYEAPPKKDDEDKEDKETEEDNTNEEE